MRKVIIESPFAGDIKENIKYARECMRHAISKGEAPLASHLLYTQPGILDDLNPSERAMGIEAGLVWGRLADATVVYEDLGISDGMVLGVERAKAEGRTVEFRRIRS